MPRYYFHVCNGTGFTEDEEGMDFPDVAAARKAAIAALRDIMAAEMQDGALNMGSFIEIEDERHALVMTVQFSEAVQVSNDSGPRRRR